MATWHFSRLHFFPAHCPFPPPPPPRQGATISGTPTNVVTAVFVETHGPVMLLLDVLSVAVLAPQVEKDWGSGVFLRVGRKGVGDRERERET